MQPSRSVIVNLAPTNNQLFHGVDDSNTFKYKWLNAVARLDSFLYTYTEIDAIHKCPIIKKKDDFN